MTTIAVLRGGGLGDLTFALPAIAALRAAYPLARVTLIAPPWAEDLLVPRGTSFVTRATASGRPLVDDVLPLSEGAAAALSGERPLEDPDVAAFLEAARRRRFDLAIQLHGGGRHSNPFIRALRPRVTVGSVTPDAEPLDRSVPFAYWQSEVMRGLEIVDLVGAPPVVLEPRIPVTVAGLDEARALLPDLDDPGERATKAPIVAVHPGAGDPRRRWPAQAFGSVVARLRARGARVALVGSEADAPLTALVADVARRSASELPHATGATDGAGSGGLEDLAGRLSLRGLAGLLALASLAIGNDSGPLNLARAVGCPSVGVYWFGNLINAGPASRRRHRPGISWRRDCPVCGLDCLRARCPHDPSFVADVTVAEVLDAALDLLAAGEEGTT